MNDKPISPNDLGDASGLLPGADGPHVKEQARRLGDAVKQRAIATSEDKKSFVADQVGAFVDKLEGIAQPEEGAEAGLEQQLIERGAAILRRFQSTLQENSTEDLLRKAEAQVKARPALFIAGCGVLGFLGARLVRK